MYYIDGRYEGVLGSVASSRCVVAESIKKDQYIQLITISAHRNPNETQKLDEHEL